MRLFSRRCRTSSLSLSAPLAGSSIDFVLQSWKWVWNFPSLVVCSSCCLWFCSLSWPIMVTMLLLHTNARALQTPLPMSRKRCPWTMSAFIIQVRALFSSIFCCIWDTKRCGEIDIKSILYDHLTCFNDYSVTCVSSRDMRWVVEEEKKKAEGGKYF